MITLPQGFGRTGQSVIAGVSAGVALSRVRLSGGTWRLAGCRDYWSKYELGW